MPRPVQTPPAVLARDAALRRLRHARRALATGTVVLAVLLTALAARGFSGHTATAAAHVAGTSSTKTHATRRAATRHNLVDRRGWTGERSHKRLSRPSAPPATAQTTTATAQTTTAPAPAPAPAPVVSGGS